MAYQNYSQHTNRNQHIEPSHPVYGDRPAEALHGQCSSVIMPVFAPTPIVPHHSQTINHLLVAIKPGTPPPSPPLPMAPQTYCYPVVAPAPTVRPAGLLLTPVTIKPGSPPPSPNPPAQPRYLQIPQSTSISTSHAQRQSEDSATFSRVGSLASATASTLLIDGPRTGFLVDQVEIDFRRRRQQEAWPKESSRAVLHDDTPTQMRPSTSTEPPAATLPTFSTPVSRSEVTLSNYHVPSTYSVYEPVQPPVNDKELLIPPSKQKKIQEWCREKTRGRPHMYERLLKVATRTFLKRMADNMSDESYSSHDSSPSPPPRPARMPENRSSSNARRNRRARSRHSSRSSTSSRRRAGSPPAKRRARRRSLSPVNRRSSPRHSPLPRRSAREKNTSPKTTTGPREDLPRSDLKKAITTNSQRKSPPTSKKDVISKSTSQTRRDTSMSSSSNDNRTSGKDAMSKPTSSRDSSANKKVPEKDPKSNSRDNSAVKKVPEKDPKSNSRDSSGAKKVSESNTKSKASTSQDSSASKKVPVKDATSKASNSQASSNSAKEDTRSKPSSARNDPDSRKVSERETASRSQSGVAKDATDKSHDSVLASSGPSKETSSNHSPKSANLPSLSSALVNTSLSSSAKAGVKRRWDVMKAPNQPKLKIPAKTVLQCPTWVSSFHPEESEETSNSQIVKPPEAAPAVSLQASSQSLASSASHPAPQKSASGKSDQNSRQTLPTSTSEPAPQKSASGKSDQNSRQTLPKSTSEPAPQKSASGKSDQSSRQTLPTSTSEPVPRKSASSRSDQNSKQTLPTSASEHATQKPLSGKSDQNLRQTLPTLASEPAPQKPASGKSDQNSRQCLPTSTSQPSTQQDIPACLQGPLIEKQPQSAPIISSSNQVPVPTPASKTDLVATPVTTSQAPSSITSLSTTSTAPTRVFFDNGNHFCHICAKSFPLLSPYIEHLATNTHIKTLANSDAFEPSSSKHPTPSNQRRVPTRGVEFLVSVCVFRCEICEESFTSKADAAAHLLSVEHNNRYEVKHQEGTLPTLVIASNVVQPLVLPPPPTPSVSVAKLLVLPPPPVQSNSMVQLETPSAPVKTATTLSAPMTTATTTPSAPMSTATTTPSAPMTLAITTPSAPMTLAITTPSALVETVATNSATVKMATTFSVPVEAANISPVLVEAAKNLSVPVKSPITELNSMKKPTTSFSKPSPPPKTPAIPSASAEDPPASMKLLPTVSASGPAERSLDSHVRSAPTPLTHFPSVSSAPDSIVSTPSVTSLPATSIPPPTTLALSAPAQNSSPLTQVPTSSFVNIPSHKAANVQRCGRLPQMTFLRPASRPTDLPPRNVFRGQYQQGSVPVRVNLPYPPVEFSRPPYAWGNSHGWHGASQLCGPRSMVQQLLPHPYTLKSPLRPQSAPQLPQFAVSSMEHAMDLQPYSPTTTEPIRDTPSLSRNADTSTMQEDMIIDDDSEEEEIESGTLVVPPVSVPLISPFMRSLMEPCHKFCRPIPKLSQTIVPQNAVGSNSMPQPTPVPTMRCSPFDTKSRPTGPPTAPPAKMIPPRAAVLTNAKKSTASFFKHNVVQPSGADVMHASRSTAAPASSSPNVPPKAAVITDASKPKVVRTGTPLPDSPQVVSPKTTTAPASPNVVSSKAIAITNNSKPIRATSASPKVVSTMPALSTDKMDPQNSLKASQTATVSPAVTSKGSLMIVQNNPPDGRTILPRKVRQRNSSALSKSPIRNVENDRGVTRRGTQGAADELEIYVVDECE